MTLLSSLSADLPSRMDTTMRSCSAFEAMSTFVQREEETFKLFGEHTNVCTKDLIMILVQRAKVLFTVCRLRVARSRLVDKLWRHPFCFQSGSVGGSAQEISALCCCGAKLQDEDPTRSE